MDSNNCSVMNIKHPMLFLLFLSPLVSADNRTQEKSSLKSLLSMNLEMLGQVQIYTANRELTPIEEAPSGVSVITAEQIERQGLKSLYEVLARTPGFFNATSPFMEPISNRGFAENVNTNYLLLVDGHALNDDTINGLGHSHMMQNMRLFILHIQ